MVIYDERQQFLGLYSLSKQEHTEAILFKPLIFQQQEKMWPQTNSSHPKSVAKLRGRNLKLFKRLSDLQMYQQFFSQRMIAICQSLELTDHSQWWVRRKSTGFRIDLMIFGTIGEIKAEGLHY